MKLHALIAAAVLIAAPAGAASAQSPGAQSTGPVVQVPTPPAGELQKAEAALRKTITAFEASKPNFDDMDTPLADALKQQSGTLSAMLNQWGALTMVEYKGWNPRSGVWAFLADFQNGQAQCQIGFDKDGKLETLWFKPVAA